MSEFYALWFQDYRLDQPVKLMSERRAQEMNAEIAAQGIVHLRWRKYSSEDVQFCMDCGGEYSDELPCVCDEVEFERKE